MSLLENVKEQCKAQGISVAELEKAAGLTENAIYKWGKVSPSVDKVQRVAISLRTTVDDLLKNDRN